MPCFGQKPACHRPSFSKPLSTSVVFTLLRLLTFAAGRQVGICSRRWENRGLCAESSSRRAARELEEERANRSREVFSMSMNVALGRALGLTLLVAGVAAPVAFAEEETGASVAALETVTITGSHIAKPELDAPAPILAITAEQMHSQGLTNFAEIAAQTPQFSASFGASRTQSTFSGAAASGLNEVNLRNLNARRT